MAKQPPADVTVRAARSDDVPAMAQLIESANLPPFFIDQFLDGFVLAERKGEMLGCGGVEIYGDTAVLRSIVVAEAARGLGLGRALAERLAGHARAARVTELYLFTQDAHDFWRHLGFTDVDLDGWAQQPRASWQYQFVSTNPGVFPDLRAMWRSA